MENIFLDNEVTSTFATGIHLSSFVQDERIERRGNRILWFKGERVVDDMTVKGNVRQVGWVNYELENRPIPCILEGRMLHLMRPVASAISIPLGGNKEFAAFFPNKVGLILRQDSLQGSSSGTFVLNHHQEPLLHVSSNAKSENIGRVVWSSSKLPLIATSVQDVLLFWKLTLAVDDGSVTQKIDVCNQRYLPHKVGQIADFSRRNAGKDHVNIHVLSRCSRYYLIISLESKVTVWEYEEVQEILHHVSLLDCSVAVPVEITPSLGWSTDSSKQVLLMLKEGKVALNYFDSKILDLNVTSIEGLRLLVPSGPAPVPYGMKVVGIKEALGSNVSLVFEDNSCLRFTIFCLPLDRFLCRAMLSQGEISLSTLSPTKLAKKERPDEWKSYLRQHTSQSFPENIQNIQRYRILSESDENAKLMGLLAWKPSEPSNSFQEEFSSERDSFTSKKVTWDTTLNALDLDFEHSIIKQFPDLLPRLLDSLTSSQYKSKRDVSIRKYVEMFDEFFYQLQNSGSGVDNVKSLEAIISSLLTICARGYWTVEDMKALPFYLSVPVHEALRLRDLDLSRKLQHREEKQEEGEYLQYLLLSGQIDVLANVLCKKDKQSDHAKGTKIVDDPYFANLEKETYNPYSESLLQSSDLGNQLDNLCQGTLDGLDNLTTDQMSHRFGKDSRVLEVRHILCSSDSKSLFINDVENSMENTEWQQSYLRLLADRTMALSLGRGAFTLCTHRALPTEPLFIPTINLSGKVADRNDAVVKLDLSTELPAPGGGALADCTAWPEFHNGVAAALKLAPGGKLSRSWIVYNKPEMPSYEHAGVLFGLGLTGQLSCLSMTDLYRYLSQEHDATLVGVLLGISASHRGSMDAALSKMLHLHLPSRHPKGYPDLEIAPIVQCASLMGLGMLFESSNQRAIITTLLQEIEKPIGTKMDATMKEVQDVTKGCEAYALSAGFALGLVGLGKGTNSQIDARVEDRLQYLLAGSAKSGNTSRKSIFAKTCPVDSQFKKGEYTSYILSGLAQPSKTSPRPTGAVAEELAASQGDAKTVLEGDLINLNATSPAASVALGLIYLKSSNQRVADLYFIPETWFDLKMVNPEHLSNRILMKNLIMWESIKPSIEWVMNQLPSAMRKVQGSFSSKQTLCQAQCYLLSGACLSVGIRFAGSGNMEAVATIEYFLLDFLQSKIKIDEGSSQYQSVEVLENCMVICCLAMSVILAGTGNLRALQVFRALLNRVPSKPQGPDTQSKIFYGSYFNLALATGILFLSNGTMSFGTDLASVAYLVISLYPISIVRSGDNMMYIQAYRHLYALAARTMFTDKIDIVSNRLLSYEKCHSLRYQRSDKGESDDILEFEYIILRDIERSRSDFREASDFDFFDILERSSISPEIKGFAHVSGDLLAVPYDACPSFLNEYLQNSLLQAPQCFGSIIRMLSDVFINEDRREQASRHMYFLLMMVSLLHGFGRSKFDVSTRQDIISPVWIQCLLDELNKPIDLETMQF